MKTPEEIKKGLECAATTKCIGKECPYFDFEYTCISQAQKDAIAYIQRLERERDAAVDELIGTCQVCRWEETEKCAICHFNVEAWNVHESNWEWRGVQDGGNDG